MKLFLNTADSFNSLSKNKHIFFANLLTNFMFEVPEASVPAVEICWDNSAAGIMT